jgi:hypothetical protein
MRTPTHPTLILRILQHRLKKLATASPVLAASFGTYTHRCGRPECRCHRGGPAPHIDRPQFAADCRRGLPGAASTASGTMRALRNAGPVARPRCTNRERAVMRRRPPRCDAVN